MKFVWYSPQNSKYPLFPNLLEVVNYHVLNALQPLVPVQNLSWLSVAGPDPEYPYTGGIECRWYDVSGVSREGGEYERGSPPGKFGKS